ncbi:MAG: ABC transporter substrate-binding protein [Veillonellales bacterium]
MRRKTLVFMISSFLMLSFALTGCGSQNSTSNQAQQNTASPKVKVGYYGGTCEAPVYVAFEKGFFKNQGLDVELVKVSGDVLKEGIATGKIDAVQVSPGLLKPIEQGLNIKITDGVHTGCIQAVAAQDSGISSLQDLKGKTIGVDAIGGVPMVLLSVELGKLGIDPKKDVEWRAYPSPQLSQALEKGDIAAFATWDPFGEIAVGKGARLIFSSTHDPQYHDQFCCFVGINGDVAQKNPEIAKKITAAIREAGEWIAQHPQETAELAVNKKYIGGSIELNTKLLSDYQFKSSPSLAQSSLLFHLESMHEQGILDSSTDPNELLQHMFLSLDN